MSQKELAKELNISPGVIGIWETNKRFPSLEDFIDIIDFFEISADTMLDGDRKCPPEVYKKDIVLTPKEKDLINTYRILNSDYKDVLIGKAKELKIQQRMTGAGETRKERDISAKAT
jgi:transcriptional regulator with XRE-family HTH domain